MAGGVVSEDFPALAGFRSGSLVAGYRLEAQLGAGGMAVVFRARDERLGRLVALKILAPGLAADSAFRRRFIAESRAAAAVDDPYIIPVYEAGEADGVLFIAMRFVAGGDLRGVLEREGALGPDRAAAFVSPVASALDAAHWAGLVHRDVKPANILVDSRPDRPDHVYLSDFGVSKAAASSAAGLTGTGQFLGTPDYSAPEQIQGRGVDGRTDQYALACVAYQLLAGAVPFERDQVMAVLLAHVSEPPPSLASRRPNLPAAADRVLARAMAKAPEKRYESCREFADALREALGLTPYIPAGTVSAPGHPQPPIAVPLTVDDGKSVPGAADQSRSETLHVEQPWAIPEARQAEQAAKPSAAADRAGQTPGGGTPHRRKGRLWVTGGVIAAAAVTAVAVILSSASPPPRHAGSLSAGHTASPSVAHSASPSPTPSASDLTWTQLKPGDCLTGAGLQLNVTNSSLPETVQVVPCGQKHIAEVYYSANYWRANQAYPGDTAAGNQATAECDKAFTAYDGVSPSTSQYSVFAAYPGNPDWASGDRSLQCLAYWSTSQDPGGVPLYMSIRGSDA
jgi:serine/threonine protein kinase